MKTQVSFVTDSALKKAALKKAKKKGITLKAFLTLCLENFLNDKINLGIVTESENEPIVLRQLDEDEITPEMAAEAKKYYEMSAEEFVKSK